LTYSTIDIQGFLSSDRLPILDVRSPGEYKHAHIPSAVSFPLFDDEERAVIGTAYKQQSREKAIKIGLDYFGPKMRSLVEKAEDICEKSEKGKSLIVHCWRGGMRSQAVAWLLNLYGFEVKLLTGGYKTFRQWANAQFVKEYNFHILGGKTGSGKTVILHELNKKGQFFIDFEGLASHKGSAFGNIGMPEQPSQEMFENMLALDLFHKSRSNPVIWVEDECQRIGNVNIPGDLYKTMGKSPVYFLEIPFEARLQYILSEYGSLDKERLINATLRIQKRLGGLETKNAVNFLSEDKISDAFDILLKYYDKFYMRSLDKKSGSNKQISFVACDHIDFEANAQRLLDFISK